MSVERLENIVDRAGGVAFKELFFIVAGGREKNNGNVLQPSPFLDQLGRLDSIELRHLDIEQNDGEIWMEKELF